MLHMNVLHTDRFFDVVNGCRGPVNLCVPGHQPVDLRGNRLLQGFMKPQLNVISLSVQPANGSDTARLIRFMQEDGRRD